jgi:hypothetical protein
VNDDVALSFTLQDQFIQDLFKVLNTEQQSMLIGPIARQ